MTGRERIEAAFSREGAAELPAVICYENVFIRDHWSQLTSCPWWYLQSPNADHQEQWMREVAGRIGQDWIHLFPFCSLEERADGRIEERADGVYRINPATGEARKLSPPPLGGWSAEEPVQSVREEQLPESFDAVDGLLVRKFGEDIFGDDGGTQDPFSLRSPGRVARELGCELARRLGRELYPCRHVSGPFWKTYDLWGFEGMMLLAAARPDLVKHACDRLLTHTLREIREFAAQGVAGVWIEDCFTDVLSPAAFTELNQPYIRRLVEEIRACGMNSIYYYTGNPAGKWDLLLSVGADALSFEESKKNFRVDIEEVAERLAGRCALLGNLDAMNLLQNGSEDELRQELKRQIQAGRKNQSRFIMSLGSPVTPETPVERVRLYCDLAHELSR
jgi:hypothetical protein